MTYLALSLRILGCMFILVLAGSVWAQTTNQSQLDFANGLYGRGYYGDAAVEYRSYLKKYPDGEHRETALYRLGESLYSEKKYAEALDAFKQVKTLFPSSEYSSRSSLREGVSLYRMGKIKESFPLLVDVVGREVDVEIKGEALYYLGKLYTDTKDWSSAIKAYDRLLKEAKASSYAPFAQYQLAVVYVAQGRYEPAALMFMAIGDDTTANPAMKMDSLYRAGEAYDKLGWHDAAVKSYGKLKKQFPDSNYARKADYGLAWSLYRGEKYDEAILAIGTFVKAYPKSPLKNGLDYLSGNCYLRKKDYPKAEGLFRQVIKQFPDSNYARQAKYKMAISLSERGEVVQSKTVLTALTQSKPITALTGDATFLLASLHMGAKEYPEALLQYLRVFEQFPNSEFHVDSLYKLGECYALNGELAKSAETFEQFGRSYKNHVLALEAVFHSADAYFQLGDFQQALVRFEHVAKDATQKRFREQALYRMAISYHNLENTKAGVGTLSKLLVDFPDSQYVSEAHFRIGDYLLYEGKNAVEAVEHFKKVTDSSTESAYTGRALKGIAVAHFSMKDFDGAVEKFYRMISTYPELSIQPDTYEWVGQHLFDREEWLQSIDVFEALIGRVKGYANPERIYLKLGQAYSASKNVDAALVAYNWIQDNALQTPAGHESTSRIATLYELQGKVDKAMKMYERAATAAMNDTAAQARFRLGELFEEQKEYDTAARNYMRVAILFLHPTLSPESMWRAGQCFEKGENPDSAIRTYSDIVAEYPDSKQSESAKARLADLKV
jgi:TolA-binding protein